MSQKRECHATRTTSAFSHRCAMGTTEAAHAGPSQRKPRAARHHRPLVSVLAQRVEVTNGDSRAPPLISSALPRRHPLAVTPRR